VEGHWWKVQTFVKTDWMTYLVYKLLYFLKIYVYNESFRGKGKESFLNTYGHAFSCIPTSDDVRTSSFPYHRHSHPGTKFPEIDTLLNGDEYDATTSAVVLVVRTSVACFVKSLTTLGLH